MNQVTVNRSSHKSPLGAGVSPREPGQFSDLSSGRNAAKSNLPVRQRNREPVAFISTPAITPHRLTRPSSPATITTTSAAPGGVRGDRAA